MSHSQIMPRAPRSLPCAAAAVRCVRSVGRLGRWLRSSSQRGVIARTSLLASAGSLLPTSQRCTQTTTTEANAYARQREHTRHSRGVVFWVHAHSMFHAMSLCQRAFSSTFTYMQSRSQANNYTYMCTTLHALKSPPVGFPFVVVGGVVCLSVVATNMYNLNTNMYITTHR